MIQELLALLTQLLPALMPIISPTEYNRIVKLIAEYQSLSEKTYAEFGDALARLDVPALNRAFSIIAGTPGL